jgi:DNA-binding LacI/PurR family transcriptional regulator
MEEAMAPKKSAGKRLTIREFAQALGVSTATVSRAIHGRGRISPATRARILAQMEQLGYTPNLHAQSLVRKRSMAVALEYLGMVEVLADSFLVELARGIQQRLVPHRYRLLLNLTGDLEYRRSVVCGWVRARAVDGVILVGNPHIDPEWLTLLQEEHVPSVWIAYDGHHTLPPNTCLVRLDTTTGWHEAVDHLVALGHRRIGYLGVSRSDPALETICQALAHHGLMLPDSHLWWAAEATPKGGYEAARAILRSPSMPTALLVRTDLLALGALRAFQEHGVRIPAKLSLVGHDDLPFAQWLNPPLSTIRVDYALLGHYAVEAIMHLLNAPQEPTPPYCVATRFLARQSTAALTSHQ